MRDVGVEGGHLLVGGVQPIEQLVELSDEGAELARLLIPVQTLAAPEPFGVERIDLRHQAPDRAELAPNAPEGRGGDEQGTEQRAGDERPGEPREQRVVARRREREACAEGPGALTQSVRGGQDELADADAPVGKRRDRSPVRVVAGGSGEPRPTGGVEKFQPCLLAPGELIAQRVLEALGAWGDGRLLDKVHDEGLHLVERPPFAGDQMSADGEEGEERHGGEPEERLCGQAHGQPNAERAAARGQSLRHSHPSRRSST